MDTQSELSKSLNQINFIWCLAFFAVAMIGMMLGAKNAKRWVDLTSQSTLLVTESITNEILQLEWHNPVVRKSSLARIAQIDEVEALLLFDENSHIVEQHATKSLSPDIERKVLSIKIPQESTYYRLQITLGFSANNFSLANSTSAIVLLVLCLVAIWLPIMISRFVLRPFGALEEDALKLTLDSQLEGDRAEKLASTKIGESLVKLFNRYKQSEEEKLKQADVIREHSFVDSESGLGNRHYFDAQFAVITSDAEEANNGCIFLIQVNEFAYEKKATHGASVKEFAALLEHFVEEGFMGIVARRSETDFALIIYHVTATQAINVAEKLVRTLEKANLSAINESKDYFHIGAAYYYPGCDTYEVLAEADMALRTAQLQGPNSWYMHNKKELSKNVILGSVRWRALLEGVIEQRKIILEESPAIQVATGKRQFVEVMSRISNNGEIIAAARFLPMAHSFGMVSQVDRLIVDQIFKKYFYLQETRVRIAINLYAESLMDPQFFEWLIAKLAENIRMAQNVCFEIPEMAFAKHANQLVAACAALIQLGCAVAVEKIGQPIVPSLYLQSIPVNYLKLHISVVRGINLSAEKQLFVKSMVELASQMDIPVFADGVETAKEFEKLKELGVFGVQGRFIQSGILQKASLDAASVD